MIELTQEQWRAITQEETPMMIEPTSGVVYVIVSKNEYDRLRTGIVDAARALRIAWMREMGLDEDEIGESLRDDPPTNIEQEIRELVALQKLKTAPSGEVLRRAAIKY